MVARLNVSTEDFGLLVGLHGLLDTPFLDEITTGILSLDGDEPIVVDVRDAVLASPEALVRFVDRLRREVGPERVAIVCDRLSGRRLLRTRCQMISVPVLPEPPDASR